MTAPRPVDGLHFEQRLGYALPRQEAIDLGRCTKCAESIDTIDMSPLDRAEWAISALCPICYDQIMVDLDEALGDAQ